MEKDVCLRCGGHVSFLERQQIQKGIGNLSNAFAGAYLVDVYVCDACGKMEFYSAKPREEPEDAMQKVQCPFCGVEHDLDDAVCPRCGKRLQEIDPLEDYR